MSENGVQVADPKVTVPAVAKPEKSITMKEAQSAMVEAGFNRLNSGKLRAKGKVGRYIEQEGEHHLARASLANHLIEIEEDQKIYEQKAAAALEKGDDKEYAKWSLRVDFLREQAIKVAVALNGTRRKADPGDAPMANVPTMPARTVITNNTQIVVHPKPEPNGDTT